MSHFCQYIQIQTSHSHFFPLQQTYLVLLVLHISARGSPLLLNCSGITLVSDSVSLCIISSSLQHLQTLALFLFHCHQPVSHPHCFPRLNYRHILLISLFGSRLFSFHVIPLITVRIVSENHHSDALLPVCLSYECHNNVSQSEWLKKQKFIPSQFWRLDI